MRFLEKNWFLIVALLALWYFWSDIAAWWWNGNGAVNSQPVGSTDTPAPSSGIGHLLNNIFGGVGRYHIDPYLELTPRAAHLEYNTAGRGFVNETLFGGSLDHASPGYGGSFGGGGFGQGGGGFGWVPYADQNFSGGQKI